MTRSVLIIGNFLSGAGGSRGVCEDLAERLKSGGWRVVSASKKRSRLLRLADMVSTAVRHRHEYAVAQLDVFSGPAFVWAETVCWTLRRLGKPYVLTLHGGNLPKFAARWPGRVKRLLASAQAVTAPSGYLKEALAPFCAKIRVIPNPIDLGRYPFRERSPTKPKLIWLRAFHEIYNPVMAVKVVAHLLEKGERGPRTTDHGPLTSEIQPWIAGLQLTMYGPDKGDGSLERVKAEIGKLKLEERVCLKGAVAKEDVPGVLARADIFLNTSNVDNTPVSVVEAMATGLCIVSTEVGGVPYLCEKRKEALLVSANDTEAMAAAVRSILIDAGLSGRLSRAARAKAERFSWSEVLPKWEELLAPLLSAELPQKHAYAKNG